MNNTVKESSFIPLLESEIPFQNHGEGAEYYNSKSINLWFLSDSKNFESLIDHLLNESWQIIKTKRIEQATREGKPTKALRRRKEQRLALERIVAALYLSFDTDQTRYLRYSRDNNFYYTRYSVPKLGLSHITDIVDALSDLSYVEIKAGFSYPPHSASPIIRAEDQLIDLIDKFSVTTNMFVESTAQEVIVLKQAKVKANERLNVIGQRASPINYDNSDTVTNMRELLQLQNEFIQKHQVNLRITNTLFKKLETDVKRKPNLSALILKRIFNNDSFEQGGRFYGGWWQSLPKEYRGFITINGKPTIELDYKGMHMKIMYAAEGIQNSEDETYIYGELDRDDVKKAILTAINSSSINEAAASINKRIWPSITRAEVKAILDSFVAKHSQIECWFYSGRGIHLQYIDSQIAEMVMREMRVKHECLALPIHDSFIVDAEMESILKTEMDIAAKKIISMTIRIERKEQDEELKGVIELAPFDSNEFSFYRLRDLCDFTKVKSI
jgi:hypothetical protein